MLNAFLGLYLGVDFRGGRSCRQSSALSCAHGCVYIPAAAAGSTADFLTARGSEAEAGAEPGLGL